MHTAMIRSVASKVALFGAGVFFHGAADHTMVAFTGRAPDVLGPSAPLRTKVVLATFDALLALALYVLHRQYGSASGSLAGGTPRR